ncbi:MAG: hypothetical protein R2857_15075 [Vampirovibrionales bacterium]
MGGIAVMFLIIQVLTGGLLMLYYVPEISAGPCVHCDHQFPGGFLLVCAVHAQLGGPT